jgi:transcriptional regulator with XRE-family HTH domain
MDMNKTTGGRIKSLRIEKGLNQGEMGKLLGLDQGTVSKMERGENEPTAKTLRFLREIFGVTTDWILTGEGTKHPLPLDTEEEIKEIIDDLNTNPLFKIRVLSFCYDYKAKHLAEFINKKKDRTGRLKRGKG